MELFTWIKGRQNTTNYDKLCFLYVKIWKWGLDGYILRYKANERLPIHKDPIENGAHYRLNIKLKGKCRFWSTSNIFRWGERVVYFRPDLFYHNLVTETKVLKLSFGYVKFQ